MTEHPNLTIERDLDDIKLQVKRELATVQDLIDSIGYRTPTPHWNAPFQLHRLRRALRIHYLAMRIRDANPVSPTMRELSWDLSE